jgi:hypothetical protein
MVEEPNKCRNFNKLGNTYNKITKPVITSLDSAREGEFIPFNAPNISYKYINMKFLIINVLFCFYINFKNRNTYLVAKKRRN